MIACDNENVSSSPLQLFSFYFYLVGFLYLVSLYLASIYALYK